MTTLGRLIDDASSDTVSLSSLLRQMKVVASRLQATQLAAWVDQELVGYERDDTLPPYRGPFGVEVRGQFSGPFGSLISEAPIPASMISREHGATWARLFEAEFRDSAAALEHLVKQSDDVITATWPANAIAFWNGGVSNGTITSPYSMHGLVSAGRPIPTSLIVGILDTVRTRLLDLALSLEQIHPDAGEFGAPPVDPQVLSNVFVTNIYGNATNLAIASPGAEQEVETPPAGDLDALLAYMEKLGIGGQELDELRDAVREDEQQGLSGDGVVGPSTRRWMAKVGQVATDAVSGGAGNLIAAGIQAFAGG